MVPRDDACKKKPDEVNAKLEKLCKVNNIEIISHRNVNPKRNLNRGRLHFNNSGVSVLVRNFRDFDGIWCENKRSPVAYGFPSFKANLSTISVRKDDLLEIQQQRMDHANNIFVDHLNINSIRNKFVFVENIIKTFDLCLIAESKLDSTFPMNQFRIRRCKIFRRDRNRFGGSLMLYITKDTPSRPLSNHPIFLI